MQKDKLHLNSANIFHSAIGQVMQQVRPKNEKPFGGKVRPVFDLLYPMCRELFQIKDPKVRDDGSWVDKMIREDNYTFRDCEKYLEVMGHHVQRGIRDGPPSKVRISASNDKYGC